MSAQAVLILALDIATSTGWACGRPGDAPLSGTVRLRTREGTAEDAAFNTLAFLRDRFVFERPDLVMVEGYLNPAGHRSAAAILMQIMCYGAAAATCRAYEIRFEAAAAATIRKHFIGRANEGDRDSTKRAVLARCKALRYLPHGCTDDNRADALAAWDYACAHFARVPPRELVMFGSGR